jgi:putative restriction endonuclease
LSEVDLELSQIILGLGIEKESKGASAIDVGTRFSIAMMRIRQNEFSKAVRQNYEHRCCFPGCSVSDDRFLVGAHIARWSDVPELRGEISNGLCFCLMHDRAFEQGLFTIDDYQRVRVLSRSYGSDWAKTEIMLFDSEPIRIGRVEPSEEALLHHWMRVGF